jgi:hypothetical protein
VFTEKGLRMAKKSARTHGNSSALATNRRKLILAISLIFSVIITSAILAQHRSSRSIISRTRPSTQNEPTSLTTPSKEYIYAGSRLVATEEPSPHLGTIGTYAPSSGTFYLRNTNSAGVADVTFAYGPGGAGWLPLVGDWNNDGTDTVGLYNPATGTFYLKNSNSTGVADITFAYGPGGAGLIPLTGDWDGL